MLSFVNRELRLLYDMHFITRAKPFLCFMSPESDFAHVDRIIQHQLDKVRGEPGDRIVLAGLFDKAIPVQIRGDAVDPVVRVDVSVEDDADRFHFILCDLKFSVYQFVAIGGKTTVPFSFLGFLDPAGHRLRADVLPFDLCNSRQYGYHQFSCIFGAVDPVFDTDQIDAKILHRLQRIQNICCIPSEAGEFEDQNVRHTVLAFLNV